MRRLALVFAVLLATLPVVALQGPGAAIDAATVQDVFLGDSSWHVSLDLRCPVAEDFELRLPVSFTFNGKAVLTESGMQLVYRPWEGGLFMGLSLVQLGFLAGDTVAGATCTGLNEVFAGYTFRLSDGLVIEPSVTVRDPSGTYVEEYSLLKGEFPCYSRFRIRLSVGYQMDRMPRWMSAEED